MQSELFIARRVLLNFSEFSRQLEKFVGRGENTTIKTGSEITENEKEAGGLSSHLLESTRACEGARLYGRHDLSTRKLKEISNHLYDVSAERA